MEVSRSWMLAAAMCVLAGGSAGKRVAAQTAPEVRMCGADDVAMTLDQRDGEFTGMSQNGTLLILRNRSASACRVEPFASIALLDANGSLPIRFRPEGARFLHPGPVVFPIVVPPGARVTSRLRWVAGPVYDSNYCVTPKRLQVTLGGRTLAAAFSMQICGEQGKEAEPTMTRLGLDTAQKPGTDGGSHQR